MRIGIIGAGSGGYEAAIRAAQLGAEVVLFEKERLGGTCLHHGCMPTKIFWKNGEVARTFRESEIFGFDVDVHHFSMERAQNRKKEIIEQLTGGIEQLIASYDNLRFVQGEAQLQPNKTITVDGKNYAFDRIILATGAKAFRLPIPGADLPEVLTSQEALELETLPESIVIIGAGVIGLEFAAILNALGVHVIVASDYLLPMADQEMAKRARSLLKRSGIEFHIGYLAQSIEKMADGVLVSAKKMKRDKEIEIQGDLVLMATGRVPVVEGLGLDEANIDYDKKGIFVNENYETSQTHIYAVGDVIHNGVQLAHVAAAQGIYVVEKLLGENPDPIKTWPSCYFLYPEMAEVGATEEVLKEKNIVYDVFKFQFAANGKALSLNEGQGYVKILCDKDRKNVLGVHILGPHASDLIHEAAAVISSGTDLPTWAKMIHAHPSLSECLAEAVHGTQNKSIHLKNL